MGQKVNPTGYRTGVLYDWDSLWYADPGRYKKLVAEDYKLRQYLEGELRLAGLTRVEIKRSINTVDIYLHIARPGVVIGKGGSNIERLKKALHKMVNKNKDEQIAVQIHPVEVSDPELSAKLVGERIAHQIERRYPHRRAKDQAIEKVMSSGALGIKIVFSGRIGGAEISRVEKYDRGKMPTSTLRADIDYAQVPALTRSGYVGIKVWIYKGEKQTT